MKKLNLQTISLTVAAVALVGSVVAFGTAMCARHTRPVGLINFNVVREKAKAFQAVVAEQQKYDMVIKEKMDKELAPLQAQAEKLEKEKASLSGTEISKQMTALQKRALEIQEKYRPNIERNMLASQLALRVIEPQIEDAVKATADRTGMSILVNIQAILFADNKVDVTDVFVEELDKLVDKVTYPDPAKLTLGAQ